MNEKIKKLITEKLSTKEKIGNKRLKEIFNILSDQRVEVSSEKIFKFFGVYLDHFNLASKYEYLSFDNGNPFVIIIQIFTFFIKIKSIIIEN